MPLINPGVPVATLEKSLNDLVDEVRRSRVEARENTRALLVAHALRDFPLMEPYDSHSGENANRLRRAYTFADTILPSR